MATDRERIEREIGQEFSGYDGCPEMVALIASWLIRHVRDGGAIGMVALVPRLWDALVDSRLRIAELEARLGGAASQEEKASAETGAHSGQEER